LRLVIISALCLIAVYNNSVAQNLSMANEDSIKAWKQKHNPTKAAIYSAIIPGAGQIYNRKIWKVPIVYGGFYGLFHSWIYNQTKYKEYYYTSVSVPFNNNWNYLYNGVYWTKENLENAATFYKRWRNLSLIGIFAWYTINIVDARVDAFNVHLDLFAEGKVHSPQRAAVLSAAIPGMGQIYNRKYWKTPAIYLLAGGLYFGWRSNNEYFTQFNNVYKNIPRNSPTDSIYLIDGGYYLKENIYKAQEYYRRWKDLNLIGFGLLYLLNIIDATVDGYMINYDVSNDLSFHLHPEVMDMNSMHYGKSLPLGLRMSIKF